MTRTTQSSYTDEQITIWLRGLLTLAWADGHFDPEEQDVITSLLHQDLTDVEPPALLEPLTAAELAAALSDDPTMAENFLRMAVMVALADGEYSTGEDELLQQYCQAVNVQPEALQVLRSTFQSLAEAQPSPGAETPGSVATSLPLAAPAGGTEPHLDVLQPVRHWLDGMEIHDPKVARLLCKVIPPQCPFERDIVLFGRKLVHIPPLCKLNPLYEQLVGLRFRALSYLADDCHEDISEYC